MTIPGCPTLILALLTLAPVLPGSAQAPSADPRAEGRAAREAGSRALDARRFREAAGTLEHAVALAPDVEGWYLLGRAYRGEDRPYSISADKAITAFRRAVALDPKLTSPTSRAAAEQLALAALRNERLDEARAAYERLLVGEADPDRLARFRTQIDEIDLDRGVYTPPPLRATYNDRGELLGPVGPREMQTNQNFEKGHQAYYNLAQALIHMGRYARVWQLNRPDQPPYVRAHVLLLKCSLELGDIEKAVAQWKVLDEAPGQDNWEVLYFLRLRVATGRAAEALPVLEQGARDDPDNVDVLYALATAYAALGRYGEAGRQMQEALKAEPKNPGPSEA